MVTFIICILFLPEQAHGSSREHREIDRAAAAAAAAAVTTGHTPGRERDHRDHRPSVHGQVGDRKKVIDLQNQFDAFISWTRKFQY